MLVQMPSIPPTNLGIRQFLYDLGSKVLAQDIKCPGYSFAFDPDGRCLVSATCATPEGLYSIRIEVNPVESQPDKE